MQILLAIIITATLSFGCATLEDEQTTVVSGGGGTKSAPSTSAPAVTSWSVTKQFGTSSPDHAYGISTDIGGNVYVTGHTSGGLDGNTNAGSSDLFVVKYDNGGIKQWTQQLGTYSSEFIHGIATDTSGNVYVTGHTNGGLDGNTNAGSSDLFVVKYDSGGIKQWTQQLGTAYDDYAQGIATDTSGNVYVTGYTWGGLGGNTNVGSDDLFVVKYDSEGIKQWVQQFGSSSPDHAYGISADTGGNVYVTGSTSGGLDGNTNAGSNDIFVVKYDSGGNKQ
jgi:hypothetical protein